MGINPNEYLAGFVNDWQNLIKPELDKGNLDTAQIVIGDRLMRHGLVKGDLAEPLRPEVNARYEVAVRYFNGLWAQEDSSSQRLVELVGDSVDRLVADIDLIMNSNKEYKSLRRETPF